MLAQVEDGSKFMGLEEGEKLNKFGQVKVPGILYNQFS